MTGQNKNKKLEESLFTLCIVSILASANILQGTVPIVCSDFIFYY